MFGLRFELRAQNSENAFRNFLNLELKLKHFLVFFNKS